jgi:predicted amidophosphoribosyltransferase
VALTVGDMLIGKGMPRLGGTEFRDDVCGLLGAYRCASCRVRRGPLCTGCFAKTKAPDLRPPPPEIDRMVAGWDYSGAARALILGLKLRSHRACAAPLAARLAERVRGSGLSATILTWVPGRRRDVKSRGFDHAAELARLVARELGMPAAALLARHIDRPDQAGLPAAQRLSNLRGSFRAGPCPPRVALVDDLVTTGATATACAAALRAGGAAGVELLVACSAAPPRVKNLNDD